MTTTMGALTSMELEAERRREVLVGEMGARGSGRHVRRGDSISRWFTARIASRSSRPTPAAARR